MSEITDINMKIAAMVKVIQVIPVINHTDLHLHPDEIEALANLGQDLLNHRENTNKSIVDSLKYAEAQITKDVEYEY